jgi:hypothetical protein
MGFLASESRLHKQVGRLPVPHHWYQYASWAWIADLWRRHPGKLGLFEGVYPAGGTVWFVFRPGEGWGLDSPPSDIVCRIKEDGHVDNFHSHESGRCPIEEDAPEGADNRFNTLDIMFAKKPRKLIVELEACVGLGGVAKTPATVAATIGPRVIASALGLLLHTPAPLRVFGALYDGVFPHNDALRSFPQLQKFVAPLGEDGGSSGSRTVSAENHPHLHSVFLLEDIFSRSGEKTGAYRPPCVAIDIATGTAFLAHSTVNLMEEFTSRGRNIEDVAFDLVQRGRRERAEDARQ